MRELGETSQITRVPARSPSSLGAGGLLCGPWVTIGEVVRRQLQNIILAWWNSGADEQAEREAGEGPEDEDLEEEDHATSLPGQPGYEQALTILVPQTAQGGRSSKSTSATVL